MPVLHPPKAIIFDFDGTLAVLNIDFSSMRERIFELAGHYGIKEDQIQEKYLLEVIDEIYWILLNKNICSRKILSEIPSNSSRVGNESSGKGQIDSGG